MDRLVPSWASRRGRPYLVRATEPNGRVFEFHWNKGMDCVFIGRHSDCDLTLRQTDASRFHACLARDKHEDLYIVDLNSRAGTYVDGNRVKGKRSHRRIQIHPEESTISIGTKDATILTLVEKSESKRDWKEEDKIKKSHINEHHSEDLKRVRNEREFHSSSSDPISVHRKRKPYSPPVQIRSGPEKQDINSNETTSAVRSGMTVEQKRQLLWGKKKEQQEEIAIRWDTAEFQTTEQRSKFQRLMGMKTADHVEEQPVKTAEESRGVLKGEAQEEVLQSVEKHFVAGLRRADGRTVGLGL